MKGTAQQSRTTNKPSQGADRARPQPRARVGAGNRHRADALELPGILQAKLTIGKANDPFEQEADRVAEEVMRMPAEAHAANLNPSASGNQSVQRKCSCGKTSGQGCGCDKRKKRLSLKRYNASSQSPSEAPPSVDEVFRSSGQPLDSATRAFMEPRFGYDFADVRVHTNSAATRSVSDVNALAFTVGNHIAFGSDQYAPGTPRGNRLLAHELAHVVQQGGAVRRKTQSEGSQPLTLAGLQASNAIQRAGDPTAIPPGFRCPTDLTPGAPAGTDLLFPVGGSTITPAHTLLLTTFVAAWVAAGGTDAILVHGYASTLGDQAPNWELSCARAEAVQAELIRLGIPAIHIDIVAHGESTDFGASAAANQHAVVSTSAAGFFSSPFVFGILTPVDSFAGRSFSRFGVGEVINLDFFSIPPRPAADFGGLQWFRASGTGTLTAVTAAGTATYTAPAAADTVTLELRVASGATAGRVVVTRVISIVEPSAVRMVAVAGSAPGFSLTGTIPAGTWGAGFQANVFVDPKDVSFQGVVFGEGTVASVVTGSFQGSFVHPTNTFGPGHAGNAATGTPVSPPVDNIVSERRGPAATLPLLGPTCGASDFLWAIPWEFRVAGGPRTPFAGGFTANHHVTSTFFCEARIEKGGAGPFCRRINGTTC